MKQKHKLGRIHSSNTKQFWGKIKHIETTPQQSIPALKTQDEKTHTHKHTSTQEKSNNLAGTYANINSGNNYDNQFLHHKTKFKTNYANFINNDTKLDLGINPGLILDNSIKYKQVQL